ncbi:hypothetical protein NGA35_05060 [Pseudomonas stutzeri]|nr:hypothetical protein [Stutzerimonas stutzeri]
MSMPPISLTDRLATLLQRLGLGGRGSQQLREQAARLRLPFASLPDIPESIWWLDGPPLQRLAELPRGALSGPVQEDKAAAHSVLRALIQVEERQIGEFDLRWIDGLGGPPPPGQRCARFEDYAASPACRAIRLISYKDFSRALAQALPHHASGETLYLRQASWRGERYFWSGEQAPQAFACAVAYARRRGLTTQLPAVLSQYSLNRSGLDRLEAAYHVLAMPAEAWSDARFMRLLLTGMPYARLNLLRDSGGPEFLLLPRSQADADALGEGLRQAGAADVSAWLRGLQTL